MREPEKRLRDIVEAIAATYRRLGEKAACVRQRSFEPLQQEQMVMVLQLCGKARPHHPPGGSEAVPNRFPSGPRPARTLVSRCELAR